MKKSILFGLLATLAFAAFADEARWIWYPGDYGIWQGNRLQAQRLQWGARLVPFWPQYEPHSRVIFRKRIRLEADEQVEVRCDGLYALCWVDGSGFHEGAALMGRFTVPKDATELQFKTHNGERPPAVWVSGPTIKTDSTWTCGWTNDENVEAESSARYVDPATPPGLTRLPTVEKLPVRRMPGAGSDSEPSLAAVDFGEETFGYLKLRNVKGHGVVKVIYAESEAEMRALHLANTRQGALDGWEMLELSETAEWRREIAHGFRYVNIVRVSGDVTIGDVALDYEWKDVPVRGGFRCDDEELNRIWDVAVHTLELTCREVFIEGVKRDHWVWSGDAVQSFLMNYYAFGDYDGCRDTLWTLRGKDPVTMHLNSIMDYSFYWFDAVAKYRLYSGDSRFARQVYPRMKSFMEWLIGRLDGHGRPVDRPGDWMFIDWAPAPLHNHGGVTSFEQMLFVRALESTAAVADSVGAASDAASYRERAAKLRAEVKPLFWNEEKGCLMHLLKNDGTLDDQVTRYPNMFGLFFGYFDAAERERVVKNVLLNDEVLKIQTPYMRFYELESLCAIGRQAEVLKEMKSYWGDMLRLGATSFWELYNPAERGEQHYAMYGRAFGKSLCHAWGASPVYLLGRYFMGVEPVKDGFAEYSVRPVLGGLRFFEGKVPTPHGEIRVKLDAKECVVHGIPGGVGTLHLNGRTYAIGPDAEVRVQVEP